MVKRNFEISVGNMNLKFEFKNLLIIGKKENLRWRFVSKMVKNNWIFEFVRWIYKYIK